MSDWRDDWACEGPPDQPPYDYDRAATMAVSPSAPVEFWVVRHIPTGKLFPASRQKGMTWQNPVDIAHEAPRLWSSRGAALKSLAVWLRGGAVVQPEQWGEEGAYTPPRRETLEMEYRRREEFEAVRVALTEVA